MIDVVFNTSVFAHGVASTTQNVCVYSRGVLPSFMSENISYNTLVVERFATATDHLLGNNQNPRSTYWTN